MPITREDVRRNIFSKDMARSHKSNVKTAPAPALDKAAMPAHKSSSKSAPAADQGSNVASNLRTRPKPVSKPDDPIRLDRLNTAEFDQLLGEGSDPNSQVEKKKLTEQKKVQTNLRLNNICAINSQILQENSVRTNIEQEQEHEQSGSPTHRDKDLLEDTLPLNDSSLNQEDIAIGSEAVPTPSDGTNVVPPPVNNQLIVEKYMDREVQTERVIVICSCPRCEGTLILKSAETIECQFLKTSEETSKILSTSFGSLLTATSDNIKRDTPLYKGSTILLTSTDKSMLKDLNPEEDDPKEFVTMIMEGLYTVEEMANMSAMGRTPGSNPMDPTIFKQIFAYLRHKYKDIENIDITKSAVVTLVNAKCYAMRRQCWEKIRKTEVDSDGKARTIVRKPLPKKGKDPNKPCLSVKRKRKPTEESLPPHKKQRKDRSDRGSKTARCDESAKKKNKEGKKHRKVSHDSSEIRYRKSEKMNSPAKEMRSKKLHRREEKENKATKEKRSEKDSRSIDQSTRKEVSSEGHNNKGGKSVGRMFQSDASKHHWLSPKKGNTRGQRMSVSPKKGNTRVQSSGSSPVTFHSHPVGKPTSAENDMLTSTPKFGGKRPKSMEELLKYTFNNKAGGHRQQNDDDEEDEDEDDDDDEKEEEEDDDRGSGNEYEDDDNNIEYMSDNGAQCINSSTDDSEGELVTD